MLKQENCSDDCALAFNRNTMPKMPMEQISAQNQSTFQETMSATKRALIYDLEGKEDLPADHCDNRRDVMADQSAEQAKEHCALIAELHKIRFQLDARLPAVALVQLTELLRRIDRESQTEVQP